MDNERKQKSDESIADGAIILSDLRELTFLDYNPGIFKDMIELYQQSVPGSGIVKYALLVGQSDWNEAKEMERQFNSHGFDMMIFNLFDVACLWLGVDEEFVLEALERISSEA